VCLSLNLHFLLLFLNKLYWPAEKLSAYQTTLLLSHKMWTNVKLIWKLLIIMLIGLLLSKLKLIQLMEIKFASFYADLWSVATITAILNNTREIKILMQKRHLSDFCDIYNCTLWDMFIYSMLRSQTRFMSRWKINDRGIIYSEFCLSKFIVPRYQ
jgi:hypothetical protein